VLCRVPEALGKVFAECRTRQRGLGEQYIGKGVFAEYFFLGHSAQTLSSIFSWALGTDFVECQRVLGKEKRPSWRRGDGDGAFAKCLLIHSTKKLPLCRVSADHHSAKNPSAGPFVRFFVECSVWHSAKRASLPSARALTLGKEVIPMPRSCFFADFLPASGVPLPLARLEAPGSPPLALRIGEPPPPCLQI
jgi:hypothetical protein